MCSILAEKHEQVNCEISGGNGLFRKRHKISIEQQIQLHQEISCFPRETSIEIVMGYEIELSISQINRIRKEWGLARKAGRPKNGSTVKYSAKVVANVPQVGVTLFSLWLQEESKQDSAVAEIKEVIAEYKENHPEEHFRLLNARSETIEKKWQALMLLPLLSIKKLSQLDYKAHNLKSVLGYTYGSSALTQFLGELERVGAESIKSDLANNVQGNYCYIDAHLMAFWSRVKMNKGYITMLGRIMPGSKAVLAHDEEGNAIGLEYYPPDRHLTHIVADYCSAIVATTGINCFIIDREVNSVETARLFVAQGWNLICLLDANEYKGLESFHRRYAGKLDDGTIIYKASWKNGHPDDPRVFFIAQEPQRTLVYWSTPQIAEQLTGKQTITIYRNRTEIQENSIKKMIAHCALDTNYGIKKIATEDRSHQRKAYEIDSKLGKVMIREQKLVQNVSAQNQKIQDAENKNHLKLLEKRQTKLAKLQAQQVELQKKIATLNSQKRLLGTPSARSDRDFRKQTIMTFRSLCLFANIKAFFILLCSALKEPISLDVFLELFFFRPGFLIEQDSQFLYYLDSQNLSSKYQCVLEDIISRFNSISLAHREKPILIQSTGFS
jgi:cell division protein FtsB